MYRIKIQRFFIIMVALVLIFSSFVGCTENKVEKYEKRIAELEKWDDISDDEIWDLENEKNDLENEIEDLLNQIEELNEQIAFMDDDYTFYYEHAACVSENDRYYHHPDCDDFDDSYFYIYNTELAEVKGYTPCPICW